MAIHHTPPSLPTSLARVGRRSELERRFAEILAPLNITIPRRSLRPVSQRHRFTEAMVEAFLDISGQQLVQLLKGEEQIKVPLDQLEVLVTLFYSTISDAYIGVDSHLPSRFLKYHPFLLENLESSSETPIANVPPVGHRSCYGPTRVRILPHSVKTLNDDYTGHRGAARDYFQQNQDAEILLLQIDPPHYESVKDDTLTGVWTGDLGVWVNTGVLLFDAAIQSSNSELQLELVYPGAKRFEKCINYVRRLIEVGKPIRLRGDSIVPEAFKEHEQEHLLWCLGAMFEPELADAWAEFVAAPRRIRRLGPFIRKHLSDFHAPPKILDAAMGTGAESIYLLREGYDVTSNEIEPRLIAHAQDAALKAGVKLEPTRFDWRHLEYAYQPEEFDSALVLGNSLSCLSSLADVRDALTRFAYVLRPGGLLVIDERNYPMMLSKRRDVMRPDFRFPGSVVYCSKDIRAHPIDMPDEFGLDHQLLTLEYNRQDGTAVGRFEVLPFKEDQLESLLEVTGFTHIRRFYNLSEPNGNRETAEFVTYTARRTFDESELQAGSKIDAVVVFTDIKNSTGLKRDLGEDQYNDEFVKHQVRTRQVAKRHKGRIVDSNGDGWMLAFLDAAAAINFARELAGDTGSGKLVIRAGINMGRVTEVKRRQLRGHTVDVASRICDAARPDRIVADDRVKLAAPAFDWTSEGQIPLKGAETRTLWRLT